LGSEDFKTYFLCLLAETLAKGGETEAALDVITEALGAVERSGERFYAAELHRQKGELLLMTGHDLADVARCFGTAVEIARHQRAWALERRALQSFNDASGRPNRGA
jgi:predicted ATPase